MVKRNTSLPESKTPPGGRKPEDDLDENLIESLQEDGRLSNMALSRKFGVSEALVRQRLKRLFDSGAIQAVAIADLRSSGFQEVSLVTIAVASKSLESIVELLRKLPQVTAVFMTSGPYQIASWWISRDINDLNRMVDEHLRAHPAVRGLNVRAVVSAHKFDHLSGFISP